MSKNQPGSPEISINMPHFLHRLYRNVVTEDRILGYNHFTETWFLKMEKESGK